MSCYKPKARQPKISEKREVAAQSAAVAVTQAPASQPAPHLVQPAFDQTAAPPPITLSIPPSEAVQYSRQPMSQKDGRTVHLHLGSGMELRAMQPDEYAKGSDYARSNENRRDDRRDGYAKRRTYERQDRHISRHRDQRRRYSEPRRKCNCKGNDAGPRDEYCTSNSNSRGCMKTTQHIHVYNQFPKQMVVQPSSCTGSSCTQASCSQLQHCQPLCNQQCNRLCNQQCNRLCNQQCNQLCSQPCNQMQSCSTQQYCGECYGQPCQLCSPGYDYHLVDNSIPPQPGYATMTAPPSQYPALPVRQAMPQLSATPYNPMYQSMSPVYS